MALLDSFQGGSVGRHKEIIVGQTLAYPTFIDTRKIRKHRIRRTEIGMNKVISKGGHEKLISLLCQTQL